MKIKRNPPDNIKGIKLRKQLFDMRLPGQDFVDKISAGNQPASSGIYLVFYEYDPPLAHSNTKRHPGITLADYKTKDKSWQVCRSAGGEFATYSKGAWGTSNKVLAFMGPIPVLNLEMLKKYTPGFIMNQTFYVGTLKEAANKKYSDGPFTEYFIAFLSKAEPDQFIFVYDSNDPLPTPLAKYSEKVNTNWKTLNEKQSKKYLKIMKDFRK